MSQSKIVAHYRSGRKITRYDSASSWGLVFPGTDDHPYQIEIWGGHPANVRHAEKTVDPDGGKVIVYD